MNSPNVRTTHAAPVDPSAPPETQPGQSHGPLGTQEKARAAGQNATGSDQLDRRLQQMFKVLEGRLKTEIQSSNEAVARTLVGRMEELEHEVNALEGMLRIELAPNFRSVLNETLDDRKLMGRQRGGGPVTVILALTVGLVAGVVFEAELLGALAQIQEYIHVLLP